MSIDTLLPAQQPARIFGPAGLSTPKLGADNLRAALRKIADSMDIIEVHETALRALAFDKRMRGEA